MKRFWLAMILLFLCTCSQYPFIYHDYQPNGNFKTVAPIYIEDTWDASDRAQLRAAINQWNIALNGTIILQIENDHYHYIPSAPTNKLILLQCSEQFANHHEQYISLAWTHGRSDTGVGGNRIYFVSARLKGSYLYYVALHELGHALGADHMIYKGLMNPHFTRDDYRCIDRSTLLQVAKYRHLSITEMRWCH